MTTLDVTQTANKTLNQWETQIEDLIPLSLTNWRVHEVGRALQFIGFYSETDAVAVKVEKADFNAGTFADLIKERYKKKTQRR